MELAMRPVVLLGNIRCIGIQLMPLASLWTSFIRGPWGALVRGREPRCYALLASQAICRARTRSLNLFSPEMMIT